MGVGVLICSLSLNLLRAAVRAANDHRAVNRLPLMEAEETPDSTPKAAYAACLRSFRVRRIDAFSIGVKSVPCAL